MSALIFAAAMTRPGMRRYARSFGPVVGLGAAYGVVLWIVAAGVVMPVWMGAVGMAAPAIPYLVPMGFVTHLVYGVVLAAVCFAVWPASREAPEPERATA